MHGYARLTKTVLATHFDPRVSTQQLKKCIAMKPADLVSDLETLLTERTTNYENKKRRAENHSLNRGTSIIAGMFSAQAQPLADAAILRFIASQGLAPTLVRSAAFRDMIRALRDAPASYKPPTSHSMGRDTTRSGAESSLGHVLQGELVRTRRARLQLLTGVSAIGGTICNDGAKWRKRS